jgi:uncharacterized protein (DUF2384 family)
MSTHLRTRDLPSDPSEIAHFLSETIGLEDDEIATMTGVARDTASRWLHTEQTPRGGDALRAVVSVIQLLGEPATAGRARDFLRGPNNALQHRTPIDALGAGDIEAVLAAAEGVVTPVGSRTPAATELRDSEVITDRTSGLQRG